MLLIIFFNTGGYLFVYSFSLSNIFILIILLLLKFSLFLSRRLPFRGWLCFFFFHSLVYWLPGLVSMWIHLGGLHQLSNCCRILLLKASIVLLILVLRTISLQQQTCVKFLRYWFLISISAITVYFFRTFFLIILYDLLLFYCL